MNLPEACEVCASTGGYWVESIKGGMTRCACPRGRALAEMAAEAAKPPQPREPVMTSQEAEVCLEMMAGCVSYVPAADNLIGRGAVTAEIREMCASFDQAVMFVRRFARLYRKWPGTAEMRWAFRQMGFKPLDAIEPIGDSELYPDGLPESAGGCPKGQQAIEAPQDPRSRELPSGEVGQILRSLVGRKAL